MGSSLEGSDFRSAMISLKQAAIARGKRSSSTKKRRTDRASVALEATRRNDWQAASERSTAARRTSS